MHNYSLQLGNSEKSYLPFLCFVFLIYNMGMIITLLSSEVVMTIKQHKIRKALGRALCK